ncbi:zinc finger MYM-type protein 3-like [Anableps anableps]
MQQKEETQSLIETISSYMDDLGTDYQPSFNPKDFESDCSLELFSQPQSCCIPPDPNARRDHPTDPPPPAELMAPNLQSSLVSLPAAGLVEETEGNVQNNPKGENVPEKAEEEMLMPQQLRALDSQCGVDAWRRWIQWRESQTSLGLLPTAAGRLEAEMLECSSSELSHGLCLFIREVKHHQGDSCSPDGLFYLCLSIQQYLFENSRLENIFTDQNYLNFSSELTRSLKYSRPSLSVPRCLPSRVEEEFLWGV